MSGAIDGTGVAATGTRPARRAVLRAVTPAAVLLGLGAPLAGCGRRPATVRLAAGEAGGFYAEFGRLLADALDEAGQPAEAITTGGSVDNVARLRAGSEQIGLALADALAVGPTSESAADLQALGRVYENYLQLVVRRDEPATDLAGLAGRRVSTGNPGSGAALTSARVLDVAGVQVRQVNLPLTEAVTALGEGRIDAVLFSGGVPTPALADSDVAVRLLPLADQVDALRGRWGSVYRRVRVPAGAYGVDPEGSEDSGVETVGVSNLLLCRPDLPDPVAGRVVDVLVDRAGDLVPTTALGTQYLDQASLVAVGDVPLHPAAVAAYRRLHG